MATNWSYSVTDEELEHLFSSYCTDFTANAKQGRYGPITGRDKEVDEALLVLLQKGRKNVALLAPAGVGKTAMVVALAQKIAADEVPEYLRDARLIEVELARMAAGTTSPAEFQERFIPLCKGVAERYHGSSYAGLSDVMKPYLTAGDLMTIGATTLDEFREYVALDPAMDRRFQKVFLSVPNTVETYTILKSLRPGHEKHHGVTISNNALMTVVQMTDEHMRKRNQPDKSIITLDAAMAYQVKTHGPGTEVTLDSIYYMVGRETGLNKQALHDEKKIARIAKEVLALEGEGYSYDI
jgi:ATP-dependent Clp protease ATP-binding subunit ClpA